MVGLGQWVPGWMEVSIGISIKEATFLLCDVDNLRTTFNCLICTYLKKVRLKMIGLHLYLIRRDQTLHMNVISQIMIMSNSKYHLQYPYTIWTHPTEIHLYVEI